MKITDPRQQTVMERKVSVSCTIPYSLKQEINKYAKLDNRSASNLISILLKLGFKEYTKDIPKELLP